MHRDLCAAAIAAVLAAGTATLLPAAPAGAAEPAQRSNGVGVCFSQLAIDPSLIGANRLGEGIRSEASPATEGSGVPAALAGARNACGEPPGPGHLR